MASRILLSDNIKPQLSNSKKFGYKFSFYMKNLMVALYNKNCTSPKCCNSYNPMEKPWDLDCKEWYKSYCYRTNILLYIWTTMEEYTCKRKRNTMFHKAISLLKHLSKYSGELFIMHKVGIIAVIGIAPTWMHDYCSILASSRAFKWLSNRYELANETKHNY